MTPHFHTKRVDIETEEQYCIQCDWREKVEDLDYEYNEAVDNHIAEHEY